jgi:hypothetical protein
MFTAMRVKGGRKTASALSSQRVSLTHEGSSGQVREENLLKALDLKIIWRIWISTLAGVTI